MIMVMVSASLFANSQIKGNALEGINSIKGIKRIQGVNYWTGNTSTSWNTASNWSLGNVPTNNDDVMINPTSNAPAISGTGGVCKSLTIDANVSLSLVNTSLTVYGNVLNNGVVDAGINTFFMLGATTLGGNGIFLGTVNINSGNKAIGKGSNLTFSDLIIAAGNTLKNKANVLVNGNVSGSGTFLNDSSSNTVCYGEVFCIVTSSAVSNNFSYVKSGNQNVKDGVYNNLFLSGSGTKTLVGHVIVNGDLSITQTASLAGTFTVFLTGSLLLNSNTCLPLISFIGSNLNQYIMSTIAGGTVNCQDLKLNKSTGGVKLLASLSILSSVSFVTGNLDLNGNNIALQTGALLFGEKENSKLTGNAGSITAVEMVKFQKNVNVGGLGAIISSESNLGNVTVTRSYGAQTGINSITRYYDITPSVGNTNLKNTSLDFTFYPGELNGQNQDNLAVFKSIDGGINWTEMPLANTFYDPLKNQIRTTNITSFSRWTVGTSISNALPVQLKSFSLKNMADKVQLNWTTSMEINSKEFIIESSSDGNVFNTEGKVASFGSSNDIHNYSFLATNKSEKATYYRLKQVDLDGYFTYSNVIISANYILPTVPLGVYPNPTNGEEVFLSCSSENVGVVILKIVDSNQKLHYSEEFDFEASGITRLYFTENQKLNNGVYFIYMYTATNSIVQKLIVKKQ